jgi:D-alanine-D-alanine ligase-like ATP-grasp enzyme
MTLSTAVIAYETEEAARRRLEAFGYSPEIAAEIAVYLAQSTDLPEFVDAIAEALGRDGIAAEFVSLDGLTSRLRDLAPKREATIVWALTDGVRFYRGSSSPALARLEGFVRFGSPSTAAHLAQDKFASLALATAAGLAVPPTLLMDGEREIASLGDWACVAGPLFVKPNRLGAKIGIFPDSRCQSLSEATERAQRIRDRYCDRALIQPFVEGDDVRVSFLELGDDFADQLGIERIAKNPASETGGAFLTMKDNETLSGAKDTTGGRGGFGLGRKAAFVPHMIDLREAKDARSRNALARIIEASGRLARLVDLRDYFSIDFRIDAGGRPTFFEFEVCPAVTIYDFQNYLARRGVMLGPGLAKAMRLAFARRAATDEA